MTFLRVQATLSFASAQPSDIAINTFHFQTTSLGTVEDEALDVINHVAAFYLAIDDRLSKNISPVMDLAVYNLADAVPRFPVLEGTQALSLSSTALPNQLAYVLSYRGLYASGVNRARRRGRLFLGPVAALDDDATGDDMVDPVVADALVVAATELAEAFVGTESGSTIRWQVFSPTTWGGSGPLDTAMADVVEVSVPNRYGVVRSRRTEPTARTTAAIS